MWIMLIIASAGFQNSGYGIASVEFKTKESCVSAATFSKKRGDVTDAWCVQK